MLKGLLDPKIDFIFKNIFGAEKNSRILISFLNSVLKSDNPIKSVEVKNTDVEKTFIEDKFSRLDVKAITDNNEIINIEMSIEEIREAKDELIKISNDKKQRELYEMRAKILKDKASALNEAERKGVEQGKIEVAKNLLKMGLSVDQILIGTGLTIEEITTIKRSINIR
ncbi:Rpn family recombination-promoting nuclease/putative transposase [Clostridium botulinum]|uniref:Rpn family recombination-promoting nuclease/putative transposase n=1 Tax=Clostridium botulinum TaxID=1491 RepID=UPI000774CCB1|nr:Rpn family recombination-promoting nuclease/putative transposase [Clostridium botulinum]NFE95405.1 Rpn family recombination-promoting nuclease/putative transposase [Clostridium botulinum]NFL38246.1 Rpn family recombination-promoting nuclease/putative transposase [Clostridium botulinum]NFL64725.1 Rpn family recombination-promoting nuclease/putative transposase [Clostridium botulinum]NFN08027.1 Rpn family recombination-promoting nuclease/putative transposase [Clostridium botulinum]NFN24226.1 